MDKGGSLMSEDKHAALSRVEWEGFTSKIEIKKSGYLLDYGTHNMYNIRHERVSNDIR